mmetsp:Transcript_26101/g.63402  ORF Transcript_26101/g.63402 Transcript_26101/m.63402 type:complete len:270 (+) Transcript_26101:232-1041(+)
MPSASNVPPCAAMVNTLPRAPLASATVTAAAAPRMVDAHDEYVPATNSSCVPSSKPTSSTAAACTRRSNSMRYVPLAAGAAYTSASVPVSKPSDSVARAITTPPAFSATAQNALPVAATLFDSSADSVALVAPTYDRRLRPCLGSRGGCCTPTKPSSNSLMSMPHTAPNGARRACSDAAARWPTLIALGSSSSSSLLELFPLPQLPLLLVLLLPPPPLLLVWMMMMLAVVVVVVIVVVVVVVASAAVVVVVAAAAETRGVQSFIKKPVA